MIVMVLQRPMQLHFDPKDHDKNEQNIIIALFGQMDEQMYPILISFFFVCAGFWSLNNDTLTIFRYNITTNGSNRMNEK